MTAACRRFNSVPRELSTPIAPPGVTSPLQIRRAPSPPRAAPRQNERRELDHYEFEAEGDRFAISGEQIVRERLASNPIGRSGTPRWPSSAESPSAIREPTVAAAEPQLRRLNPSWWNEEPPAIAHHVASTCRNWTSRDAVRFRLPTTPVAPDAPRAPLPLASTSSFSRAP